jgi:phage N-6-adenine-methyltransferase
MATERSHNDWWTPPALKSVLMKEFNFDLDAAASEENRICEKFISADQDGLKTPWSGTAIWCNPPYGKAFNSYLPDWVQRGYEQSKEQQNTVVMLLPTYTDPKYWRDYVMQAHEIRHLAGRLQFLDHGESKMSARFPSSIVIWKHIPGTHYGKAPLQWVWDWRTP